MRLKSLKLAGFKSFANATTFTFPHGITAIVGPNGCGKSNVIDAIRWVLGETSAKQLRGGAMSDVIFAGTQDKSAKSVASVELTFEHTQDKQTGIRHEFNLYHELSVRRQVNLEGRSDYFINGTRCRRRDVVDVFLGTGLGARSYAVIEQGMIGRIVESSPLQLREFIEEAAGVSRYQARRIETQKKLETTQDNLARLYDMQSELTRQQSTLSKQAASAQQYATLNANLADLKQQLAIQQLYQAKHQQMQQKTAYNLGTKALAVIQEEYEALKDQHDKRSTLINQEQWLKDDSQSAHYQQQLLYQNTKHELNDRHVQLSQTQQQMSDLEQQKKQAVDEIETLKFQQTEQQVELERLRPQLSELTAKRDAQKSEEQPLQRAWYDAQNELTGLQDSARILEQQHALNAQSQQRLQLSQDKWARRKKSWQELWAHLQSSDSTEPRDDSGAPTLYEALETHIAEINDRLTQIVRQQDSVEDRLSEWQPQAHDLEQLLKVQQQQLNEHEKSHALLAGEYDTLHQILHPKPNKLLADHSVTDNTEGVDSSTTSDLINHGSLNQASKSHVSKNQASATSNNLSITTLREQIELTPKGQQYAAVLDSVLALWLDSHVLESSKVSNELNHPDDLTALNKSSSDDLNDESQVAACLGKSVENYVADLLSYQTGQNGHSLWLPATHSHNNKEAFASALPNSLRDKLFCLSELIVQPHLRLWQHCYLYIAEPEDRANSKISTDTLNDILALLPASALLLTTDGWINSHYGTINLSHFASATDNTEQNNQFLTQRLQQRTRLEALETLLDDFEAQISAQQQRIAKTQSEYDALAISLEETRAQAAQLTRDKHHNQQQLAKQQADYERLQADMQRLNIEQVTLKQEQDELNQEKKTLDEEQRSIQKDREALAPKLITAKNNRQQLQERRGQLNLSRQADADALQIVQMNIQQCDIRLEHSLSSLARATDSHNQSLHSLQTLKTTLEQYQQQLPVLQAALNKAKVARDEQQALLAERERALSQLKQEYSQQQTTLDALQNQLQLKQNDVATHATKLALSEAKLEDASRHAQEALAHYQQLSHQSDTRSEAAPQTISISSLLTDFITHERRIRPDKITELELEITNIEKQLNSIGAINLAAIAELAEVNGRLEPLAQQTQDIAASIETLTEAIASIDETTKTLFMQTLEAVNIELANLFAKVFGGGQASLTLHTDDMPENTPKGEQWRAGLTLMAQPKGKRNSRLAVLSGGEKTLTALSLIFAIFKQHPAPFCVLDEVDAPLDDANVARFTSLIHELADDLQFIFISHNKLSMQIADELQGITMPSAGISTLVSVSLEDAQRYIES